ncbi:unnamed protein product [Owenia fusiformis]|uniref:Uncharacterized protein n=1 Tax=Owenia fusiformis TaxID=6347 RepID=A0A8J1U8T7_OWEFU|nr:unnamed protein product [Owenia fusiformis]
MNRPKRKRKPTYKLIQSDESALLDNEADKQTEDRNLSPPQIKPLTNSRKNTVAAFTRSLSTDGADVTQGNHSADDEGIQLGNIIADFLPNPKKLFNWPSEEEGNFSLCINICLFCKGGFLLEEDLAQHKCHKRFGDPSSHCHNDDDNNESQNSNTTVKQVYMDTDSEFIAEATDTLDLAHPVEPKESDKLETDETMMTVSSVGESIEKQGSNIDESVTQNDTKNAATNDAHENFPVDNEDVMDIPAVSDKNSMSTELNENVQTEKRDDVSDIDSSVADQTDDSKNQNSSPNKDSCILPQSKAKHVKITGILVRSQSKQTKTKKYMTRLEKQQKYYLERFPDKYKLIKNDEGIDEYQCLICGRTFKAATNMQNTLGQHLYAHEIGKLKCKICGFEAKNPQNYKYHQDLHRSKDDPYVCETCGAKFQVRFNLQQHITNVHKSKPMCQHCGEAFQSHKPLKEHIELVHNGEGLLRCSLCNEKYTTKLHLRHHKTHIHNAGPSVCIHCGKTLSTPRNMRQHVERVHHQIKKFACDQCSFTSYQKQQLTRHLMTHSDERPFQCELCSWSGIKRHSWMKHMNSHSDIPCYKCSLCEFTAITKTEVQEHQRTHVPQLDQQMYISCGCCNALLKTEEEMKEHYITEHDAVLLTSVNEDGVVSIELGTKDVDMEQGEAVNALVEQGNVETEIIHGDPAGNTW